MKIAIIGAGNVGGTLGRVWSHADHEITFGARDPSSARTTAAVEATGGRASATGIAAAVRAADVVLLATPWQGTLAAVKSAGDLSGKVVIDATNPLAPDLSGLELGHTSSAAEAIAARAPGARVVKAFNTIGSMHMDHADFGGRQPSMLVAGDDAEAKSIAMKLATDAGFDAVDAGPLTQARLLEPLAMLWISLAYAQGHGTDIAFELLRK